MKSMNVSLGDGSDIRLALNARQTASTKEARGLALEVTRGSVWVTQAGDADDYVLNPGERLPINARGRLVIQGLADSEVKFVRQSAPAPALPGIRAARRHSYHPGDCWRNFVSGLSTGRFNIDTPI